MFDAVIRIQIGGPQACRMWYRTWLPFIPPLPSVVVGPGGKPHPQHFGLSLYDLESGKGGGTVGVRGVRWSQQRQCLEIDAGEEECRDQAAFEKLIKRYEDCGWSRTDPRS